MISSAALPKVAFNNPPTPSPSRSASCSVARPISAASGMIASDDVRKIESALACITWSSTSATGMKTRSSSSRFSRANSLDMGGDGEIVAQAGAGSLGTATAGG